MAQYIAHYIKITPQKSEAAQGLVTQMRNKFKNPVLTQSEVFWSFEFLLLVLV
jgi:hypothetical protein